MAVRERDAVAGQRPGVRGDPEHPPEAAGREEHRLRPEGVQLAVRDPVGDDAGRLAAVAAIAAAEQQIDDVVLVVEPARRLDALLVQRLQDHVAGPVGGEAGAPHGGLAVVAGMATEPALVDLARRASG